MRKKNRAVFSLLISCAITFCPAEAQEQRVKQISVDSLLAYIDRADHPLVINFWATYCAPCVREIPWLEKAMDSISATGVELLLVSMDGAAAFPGAVFQFGKKYHCIDQVVWLSRAGAGNFCPKISNKWEGGIPATLFVNKKTGYRQFFNRQLTDLQISAGIKELLKE